MKSRAPVPLTCKLVDSLYVEAMVLADEVRTYFDEACFDERDVLPPKARVLFSCEALKVTTRLMHMITWLLDVRAAPGDLHPRLASHGLSDPDALAQLPTAAVALIRASEEVFGRVARLEAELRMPPTPSAVTRMYAQLSAAF